MKPRAGAAAASESETLLEPKLSGSETHERVKHIETPPESQSPLSIRADRYIGTVIDGRYMVEEVIGEGGMGVVYRCKRKVFGNNVAVKILRQDLAKNPEVTERFMTEAKAASAIGNPHIVAVFDFGELPDGSTYFAMEYLDGHTLGALLQNEGLVGSERVVPIGRQMAEGLAAAHAAGIVHRDLKPENVFVTQRDGADFVKILDFGIAKVAGLESKITRAGAVFGTPHYMSPEQCRGGTIDHRSDVYALGVLLYEMTTGRVPFDAENPLTILSMHLNDPPNRFDSFTPRVVAPPGLESAILKCLQKAPDDRFQSMTGVVEQLTAVERGEATELDLHISFAPPPGSDPPPEAEPAPESVERPSFVDAPPASAPPASRPLPIEKLIVPARPRDIPIEIKRDPMDSEIDAAYRGSRRWPLVVFVIVLGAAVIGGVYGWGAMQVGTAGEAIQAGRPLIFTQSKERNSPDSTETTLSVALVLSPIDAHVSRNGHDLGKMPIEIPVKKGEPVEVEVSRDGYWSRKLTLDGKKPTVTIRLAPIQPGVKPGPSGSAAGGAPPPAPPPEEAPAAEEDENE
jgi:serine/threonine protein kinase